MMSSDQLLDCCCCCSCHCCCCCCCCCSFFPSLPVLFSVLLSRLSSSSTLSFAHPPRRTKPIGPNRRLIEAPHVDAAEEGVARGRRRLLWWLQHVTHVWTLCRPTSSPPRNTFVGVFISCSIPKPFDDKFDFHR